MEYYLTKGEMLESQGKDRADVRWVDRQMAKGLVGHNENGFYFIMEYLEEENKGLKEEIKNLKEKNDKIVKESKADELEEAKVQWEYWERECRRYGRLSSNVIDICYNKFKQLLGSKFQEGKEDFKDGIIEMAKEMDKSE